MNKQTLKKDWIHNHSVYLLAIPIFLYFIIWSYLPMVGIVLAFEDYTPRGGFLFSQWVGVRTSWTSSPATICGVCSATPSC